MTDGVRQAVDLLETGDADGAARVCRQILQQDARNHQAMILLGQIVAAQWRHDEALDLLARAVSLAPKNADYHVKLAEALTTQGRQREALLRYDKALRLKADFPAALAGKAEVHVLSGQRQKARGMLEPFVEAGTESAAMAAVYALIVTRDGDHDRAVEVASRHVDDETFWPLRQNLWFRIGDAQEAAGRYDDAFDAYTHGNRTNPASWDAITVSRWYDEMMATFVPATVRSLPRSSTVSPLPVFIVGMYRSGSTLVEQILDAHPQVHGAGEVPFLPDLVQGMSAAIGSTLPYPQCINDLEARDVKTLGQGYLGRLRSLAPNAERICDKYLLNHQHLGVVDAILPGTRIIHVRRDPMDTCLSCYVHRFVPGAPACLGDLRDLGMFYNDYLALMEHWRHALEVPMLEVDYEGLVEDQEGVTRRLLEFCDLPWDDRCLRFFESGREVLTLSRDQVSRPIYRGSVARHRRYEKHLEELRDVLEKEVRGSG